MFQNRVQVQVGPDSGPNRVPRVIVFLLENFKLMGIVKQKFLLSNSLNIHANISFFKIKITINYKISMV